VVLEKQPGDPTSGLGLQLKAEVSLEETFSQERLELVRRELREALAGYPIAVAEVNFRVRGEAQAAIKEAQFLVYAGELDQALKRAQEAVGADPRSVTGWALLGSVHYLMDRPHQARQAWLKVLELDPGNREVVAFLERVR